MSDDQGNPFVLQDKGEDKAGGSCWIDEKDEQINKPRKCAAPEKSSQTGHKRNWPPDQRYELEEKYLAKLLEADVSLGLQNPG